MHIVPYGGPGEAFQVITFREHWVFATVVDLKLFFSDPDPTFQELSDLDTISDPT